MSHGRYIPVANEPPVRPSDEEMEQAFESDDGDLVSAPLTQPSGHQQQGQASLGQQQEGFVYDFEREYDHPPPGSPPEQASAFTHTIGNTNGVIPNPANVVRNFPTPTSNRPSFFRRAVGALLPQHYARVPTSDAIDVHGSGIENDGVFSNVLAKPSPRTVRTSDGEIQEMPEDAQKDVPPSYNEAQRDAVPPYWETTIHAPIGSSNSLLIYGLPAGTIFAFAWNFLISISFQFVGFMLTYLLHTTHAGKYGSRAGLGVTLIQYGLFSRTSYNDDVFGGEPEVETGEDMTNVPVSSATRLMARMWMFSNNEEGNKAMMVSGSMLHNWISFLLMTIGWFLLLSSILGFARVKRWERSITTPSPVPQPPTAEQLAADEALAARLADVFLFDSSHVQSDESSASPTTENEPRQSETVSREQNIRTGLRALGLI